MSTLSVNTVKSLGTGAPVFQNTSGTEIGTLCRAWVNFNGTGTVAIRDNFNVSSITDNGTGNYTVNYTTAFADANYSVVASGKGGSNAGQDIYVSVGNSVFTASAIDLFTSQAGGTAANRADSEYVLVAIFA